MSIEQNKKLMKSEKVQGGSEYELHFDCIEEAVAQAHYKGDEDHHMKYHADHLAFTRYGGGFTNGFTYGKMVASFERTPEHLLDAIDKMRRELENEVVPPTKKRRRVRRGLEIGDELDFDKWQQGDPNAWQEIRKDREVPRRVIRIGINIGNREYDSAEKLLFRGAAAMVLCDALTDAGCSVEIVGLNPAGYSQRGSWRDIRLFTTVILKRSDAPMDEGLVALAACEVAFYRMVMLPAKYRANEWTKCSGGSEETNPQERKGCDAVIDRDITSFEKAAHWIKKNYDLTIKREED